MFHNVIQAKLRNSQVLEEEIRIGKLRINVAKENHVMITK